MTYAIPSEVLDRAEKYAAEGRIIGGSWRKNVGGKEMVCALAAYGAGINSVADCPADYMPTWLAELIPTLDDGVARAKRNAFSFGLTARARRWSALDDAAWDRVSVAFRVRCIERALEAAERAQPTPRPAYWDQVQDACGQMIVALRSGNDTAAVGRAAKEVAEAAAWAAWAAARAEVARAAKEVAEAAAWVAEAAAWAAEAVAEAAAGAAEAAARGGGAGGGGAGGEGGGGGGGVGGVGGGAGGGGAGGEGGGGGGGVGGGGGGVGGGGGGGGGGRGGGGGGGGLPGPRHRPLRRAGRGA